MRELRRSFERGGITEVNEYIVDSKFLSQSASFMWGIVQRLTGIPQFAKEVEKAENRIGEIGLGPAMREVAGKFGLEVIVDEQPEWAKQTGQSTLVYGNHDTRNEPLILASILDRDDALAVGGAQFKKIGPNVGTHFLPVYSRKYARGQRDDLNLVTKMLYGKDVGVKEDDAQQITAESLKKAGELLARGWLVNMYPTDAEAIESKWRAGLGRIIANLPDDTDTSKILLVPMHVGHLDTKQFLLNARNVCAKGAKPRPLTVKVKFGKGIPLNSLEKNLPPDQIVEVLQKDYLRQFGNTEQKK